MGRDTRSNLLIVQRRAIGDGVADAVADGSRLNDAGHDCAKPTAW